MDLEEQTATKRPVGEGGKVFLTPRITDMTTCKEEAIGTMNRRLNSTISHLTTLQLTIQHHSKVQWPCQRHRGNILSIQHLMTSNTCISILRRILSLLRLDPTISGVYMGGIDRPGSPGIYPDRAPNMDKLNDEQKKIAKEFPKDLDEKNGSMVKNAVASIKDWRTWYQVEVYS